MSIVLKLTAEKSAPPKRGIDHYWSVIMGRDLQGLPFSGRDIFEVSNTQRSDINDFLRRLEKAAVIERLADIDERGEITYRAVVRQSATPKVRRDGTVVESASKQKCMWNTMRSPTSRQGFTATDIVIWGSTDETVIKLTAAKSYITMLAKAGYLTEIMKGSPGKLSMWRLAPDMNTGPLPPMILRTKLVFDQNRHSVMGPVVAEEVAL